MAFFKKCPKKCPICSHCTSALTELPTRHGRGGNLICNASIWNIQFKEIGGSLMQYCHTFLKAKNIKFFEIVDLKADIGRYWCDFSLWNLNNFYVVKEIGLNLGTVFLLTLEYDLISQVTLRKLGVLLAKRLYSYFAI